MNRLPQLISLLHLSDPTLPIGGYSHSSGLETYTQERVVKDVASAKSYIQSMLYNNLLYNDASFVRLAYQATKSGDIEELKKLDAECTALKSPQEIRLASQKLGARLIKNFRTERPFYLASQYEEFINQAAHRGHYCIIYGMYGALLEIPAEEIVASFFFNAATSMVTNAVKLVPLGQLDGQHILFELEEIIPNLTQKTMTLERKLVGVCNTGFDIRCMQHERLYSRLYMS